MSASHPWVLARRWADLVSSWSTSEYRGGHKRTITATQRTHLALSSS